MQYASIDTAKKQRETRIIDPRRTPVLSMPTPRACVS